MAEWTNDLCIDFVRELQKHPCIWNPSHIDKKKRNKVEDAYQDMCEALGIDVDILKRKKEMMFQTYRNYRRQVARSKVAATDLKDVYTPSWPPYKFLDSFLNVAYTPRRNYSLVQDEESSDLISFELVEDNQEHSTSQSPPDVKPKLKRKQKTEKTSDTTQSSIKIDKIETVCEDNDEDDDADVNAAFEQLIDINRKILKRKRNKPEEATRDESTIYGELIATKLRKLHEKQRALAMYKIDGVLYEIAMQQADHQCNCSDSNFVLVENPLA